MKPTFEAVMMLIAIVFLSISAMNPERPPLIVGVFQDWMHSK